MPAPIRPPRAHSGSADINAPPPRQTTPSVQTGRKSTQRERLVAAMTETATRRGYAGATIAQVIRAAGVSRPTFYEYFSDKEACFLAAHAEAHRQLLTLVARAVQEAPPQQALEVTIGALVEFTASQPHAARLLMNETLAGGPDILDARDHALGELAKIIEQANTRLSPESLVADLPPTVLLGTVYRLLGRRLRHGEHELGDAARDLQEWVARYRLPISEHRWGALKPLPEPPPWTILPETQLREPAALPPPRWRDPKEVADDQRRRILFATAAVGQSKGYAAATIGEIVKSAGVNRRAFNSLFRDKQDAFMAVIAFGFQRTIAVAAGAFFTAATWQERIWEAGRAFTTFMQISPALAHVGFVETYAVGADAAQQLEDSVNAFTVFLREGVRQTSRTSPAPTVLALEAVATSVFETAYQQSRRESTHRMSSLLPHVAFLCLAPVIGAAEANRFIDGKLA
jgi:AcrR family transcriptional regulator